MSLQHFVFLRKIPASAVPGVYNTLKYDLTNILYDRNVMSQALFSMPWLMKARVPNAAGITYLTVTPLIGNYVLVFVGPCVQ